MVNIKKIQFVISRWVITTFVALLVLFFLARWFLIEEDITAWQVVGLYGCAALIGALEVIRATQVERKRRLEMKKGPSGPKDL